MVIVLLDNEILLILFLYCGPYIVHTICFTNDCVSFYVTWNTIKDYKCLLVSENLNIFMQLVIFLDFDKRQKYSVDLLLMLLCLLGVYDVFSWKFVITYNAFRTQLIFLSTSINHCQIIFTIEPTFLLICSWSGLDKFHLMFLHMSVRFWLFISFKSLSFFCPFSWLKK